VNAGVICSEDELRSSVLNSLEALGEVGRKSKQNVVTIVQSRKDECDNKRLEHCSGHVRVLYRNE